jgi:argininosuccinate synthase
MKIKKHQAGGIYYTPFFRESLQQGQQAAASQTTSKSGDSTANQIEKEMISVLKENGLPSDVDYFLSQSEKFLNKANEFGFQDSGYGITDLIRLQSLANKVKHNKELHTDAIDRIQ